MIQGKTDLNEKNEKWENLEMGIPRAYPASVQANPNNNTYGDEDKDQNDKEPLGKLPQRIPTKSHFLKYQEKVKRKEGKGDKNIISGSSHPLHSTGSYNAKNSNYEKLKLVIGLVIGTASIISFTIWAATTLFSNNGNNQEGKISKITSIPTYAPSFQLSPSPTTEWEPAVKSILERHGVDGKKFKKTGQKDDDLCTPQKRALNWLVGKEHTTIKWSTFKISLILDDDTEIEIVQKFALATLFFSASKIIIPSSLSPQKNETIAYDKDCIFSHFYEDNQISTWGKGHNFLSYTQRSCEWNDGKYGAFCSEDDKNLEKLRLGESKLIGSIPEEIGLLSSLKVLSFQSNFNLKGTIPSSIGLLTNLNSLRLYGNQLSGSIPSSSLASLTNLEKLHLGTNKLTGKIPSNMSLLSKLQTLTLEKNDFTGTISSSFGLLTHLYLFTMGWNELTGTIPSTIGLLTRLQVLKMENNDLTGTIPSSFGLLSDLNFISYGNNLTG